MTIYNGLDIPPALEKAVHALVAAIPCGKVATYGQLAEMAGMPGLAREVGYIMSRVSPKQNLPCHRVVNRTGTLSPEYAFGGREKQRALLEAEGITFTVDGRIDVARHQWGKPEQLTFI